MNVLHQGWFSELDPFERARIEKHEKAVDNGNESSNTRSPSNSPDSEQVLMGEAWPGQAFSLRVNEVLFDDRSDFQHVVVCKTKTYGNMLVLDGVIQVTERDEFMYQEMLTHLAMFSHPEPKKVLVIGGGDGGCVREALRHPSVQSVTLCEIDKMVVDVSRRFLPGMASALDDKRVTVLHGDGFKYLVEHKNEFDVIITDSSDPIGPAESLFGKGYYELIRDALTEKGVLASQAESIFLHSGLVAKMVQIAKSLYPSVGYANGLMPTYPSGHIGYLVACKDKAIDVTKPLRYLPPEKADTMRLKYYNGDVHSAAFVLPQFARNAIAKADC